MVNVTLQEAGRFCSLIGGRLPSNEEWEYAAAGRGLADAKVSRDDANYGHDVCCGGFAAGRDKWEYTAPVGSFPANGFGLHDMLGNVWEWVAPDRLTPNAGKSDEAVLRGGSWSDSPWYLRLSYRRRATGNSSFRNAGFRCVLDEGTRSQ